MELLWRPRLQKPESVSEADSLLPNSTVFCGTWSGRRRQGPRAPCLRQRRPASRLPTSAGYGAEGVAGLWKGLARRRVAAAPHSRTAAQPQTITHARRRSCHTHTRVQARAFPTSSCHALLAGAVPNAQRAPAAVFVSHGTATQPQLRCWCWCWCWCWCCLLAASTLLVQVPNLMLVSNPTIHFFTYSSPPSSLGAPRPLD